MKRAIAGLLAGLLVLSLAACHEREVQTQQMPETMQEEAPAPEAKPEEKMPAAPETEPGQEAPAVFILPVGIVGNLCILYDQRTRCAVSPFAHGPLTSAVQRPAAQPLFQRRA